MALIKKNAYYMSSTGENKIHCTIWQDDECEPRGIFQIAHGLAEHIERYDDFATFLAENGLIVCGNDHLGHGLSAETEEEFGFFAQENGDLRLVDDMHILHNIMSKRYPNLPYYLFGQGMGSMCARVYASAFGDELSGLVISGTGELPSAAVALEEPIKFITKKMGVSAEIPATILDKIAGIAIKDKETDKDWLSKNKANVESYLCDPLCNHDLKLGGLRDIISLTNTACTDEWASLVPLELKTLIISGGKDPIGFNGKGVIGVCDNLELAGHTPTVIIYPGSRHEILHEDEKEKVYYDILEFLHFCGIE